MTFFSAPTMAQRQQKAWCFSYWLGSCFRVDAIRTLLNIPSPSWSSCLSVLRDSISSQNAAQGYLNSVQRSATAPDQLRQQNGSTFFYALVFVIAVFRPCLCPWQSWETSTCHHYKPNPINLHRTSTSASAPGNLILLIPCKFEIPFNFFLQLLVRATEFTGASSCMASQDDN